MGRTGRSVGAVAMALAVGSAAPALRAQTFDADYLAARARVVERIDALPHRCLEVDRPDATVAPLVRDLHARLERRLGTRPISIAVPPAEPTPTFRCLRLGDPHFFDALSYATRDDRGSVAVTTPGLLRAWADRQRAAQTLGMPSGLWGDGLPRDGAWYTWGIMGDAIGLVAAEIPVRATAPGTQALAYLVGVSQGFLAGQPPGNLLAIVASADRVIVALRPVIVFDDARPCLERLAPIDRQLDVRSTETVGRQAYADCWSAALRAVPGRAELAAEAQALVEALTAP